jgi:hypothetical protein
MVLEGSNGSFCSITAMDVWRGDLDVDLVVGDEVQERLGCFIVQALKAWFKSSPREQFMDGCVRSKYVWARPGLKRLRVNEVGVVFVGDHEITVAPGGCGRKPARLVGV